MDSKYTKPQNNIMFVRDLIIPRGNRIIYARQFGTTDVLLIFDEIPGDWDDMGHAENGNAVTLQVENEPKKDEPSDVKSVEKTTKPKIGCLACQKGIFVLLGIVSVIVGISLIIVAILTSIATRAYDADQSSRIAAMVLLAVTGAVSICMVIYLEVAIFKRQTRSMCGAAVVILILVIVQALIGGISVNVQPADEAKLVKSLEDSFTLAKDDVSRHYKLWAMTQHDLSCCGVYGPEDYRAMKQPYYFPPEVPVSCCPTYDPDRSDLVQEKEREVCKAKKTYFNTGCKDLVLVVFNETATIVLTVNIIMIVVQVLLLISGALLSKKLKNQKKNQISPK